MMGGQLHSRKLIIGSYCESTCNQFISWQFLHRFLCVSANACLHVPAFYCEPQHNQKLYTPSDWAIVIAFTIVIRNGGWKHALSQHHEIYQNCYCGTIIIEIPLWECRKRCAIALDARQRRAVSASIYN